MCNETYFSSFLFMHVYFHIDKIPPITNNERSQNPLFMIHKFHDFFSYNTALKVTGAINPNRLKKPDINPPESPPVCRYVLLKTIALANTKLITKATIIHHTIVIGHPSMSFIQEIFIHCALKITPYQTRPRIHCESAATRIAHQLRGTHMRKEGKRLKNTSSL